MNREGNHLRADSVIWNRVTGEVRAEGNVRVVSPEGDIAFGDSVVLDRQAARRGDRESAARARGWRPAGRGPRRARERRLHHARPRRLLALRRGRRRTAARKQPDLADHRGPRRPRSGPPPDQLSGARASTCSASPIIALARPFRIPTAAQGGGSGLLVPDIRFDRRNGVELSAALLSPARAATATLTITPHVYTERAADARGPIPRS